MTDSQRASSAAMLVVGGLGANLGLSLLSYLVNAVVPGSYEGIWPIVMELLWLGATGVLVLGLFQLSGVIDEPMLLRAAAAALMFNALVDLAVTALNSVLKEQGGLAMVITLAYDASNVLSLVARGLLIVAIVQLTMKTHAWVLPLLGTVAVLIVLRSALSLASMHGLVPSALYRSGVYRAAMPMVSLFNGTALLVGGLALKGAVAGGQNVTTPALVAAAGLQPAPAEPVAPIADFLVGGILLAVGIGVTAVSMAAASDGGRYVVATGAIAVGVVRIVRGFVRMARSA